MLCGRLTKVNRRGWERIGFDIIVGHWVIVIEDCTLREEQAGDDDTIILDGRHVGNK